jgi:hypothetical protein
MKSGRTVRSFTAKGSLKVVLRTCKCEGLDDLLELVNSLVDEKAEIAKSKKLSRKEEFGWLSKALSGLEKEHFKEGNYIDKVIMTKLVD